MTARTYSLVDLAIGEIDRAIKVLASPARANRPSPGGEGGEWILAPDEAREAARLMRVNHSGEVAAQALYQGQALTAHGAEAVDSMRQAAAEERDHLAWCEERIHELNGRTSLLNPLWYAGSFAIGALAGVLGDPFSLGFVAETEKQVETHLQGHMERLPMTDSRSRAIIEQMRHDEASHGARAASLGAEPLPFALRFGMRLASRVMTRTSYWC